MAKLAFIGTALAVSQVDTITIGGTWAATETVTIEVGAKSVTYVCGGSETTSTVAAGLQALAAGSTDAEFGEITWTVNAAVITATSTAGLPVTIAVSETAASGTIALSNVTAATGPNHWNNAKNWSTGSVPTTNDEVFLEQDLAVKYGLPTSLTLDRFVHRLGELGLPSRNPAGYAEYRTMRPVITCTNIEIGVANNVGPRLCRLSTASAAAAVLVQGTGRSGQPNVLPVELILNSGTAQVNVISGQVAISPSGADVSTVGSVRCAEGGQVEIGEGVTVTNVLSAGNLASHSSATNVTVDAGSTHWMSSATITNLVVRGGVFYSRSSGTITDAIVGPGALDCSRDIRPRTITDLELKKSGSFIDPYNAITVTNGITLGTDADQLQAT
jgi:hypothetical protein